MPNPPQDNYPEMLGRICIINAPMVFKALWGLVKPMLNPRTISKIQVRPPPGSSWVCGPGLGVRVVGGAGHACAYSCARDACCMQRSVLACGAVPP